MLPMFANVGLPMIIPQVMLMGLALLPVVIIETAIVRKSLGLPPRKAFLDVGMANLATTVIGVPIAWLVMLGLQMLTTGGRALGLDSPTQMLAAVTLQAAWLTPYEGNWFWMVPAAATVLLIPSFVVSVFIERWVLMKRCPDHDRRVLAQAVLRANVWSYVLLFAGGCLWLVYSSN